MLSNILLAGPNRPRTSTKGISVSGLYPCPHAIYKIWLGGSADEITPQQEMLMDDGKWQEEQTVQRLASRGIKIENRQMEVVVGKAMIRGHIDGLVTLNGTTRLFEHKAMGYDRFSLLKQRRLEAFPGYRTQVQVYMLGLEVGECDFFAKHKDSCEPWDFIEPFDKVYAQQIVDWTDSIVLDKWEPQPELCPLCARCGFDCFGAILDMSGVKEASAPDMVEKWKKGKALVDVGEMLLDESRAFFIGKKDKNGNVLVEGIIGDNEVLLVEDLEIKRVILHRFDVSKAKIVELFGPEALLKVSEEKDVVTYRIREA